MTIVAVFRARRTEAGDGPDYYAHLEKMAALATATIVFLTTLASPATL